MNTRSKHTAGYGEDVTVGLNTTFIEKRMRELRLTTKDVGELLGELLHRKGGAFSAWTVQTWINGRSIPDGLTLCGLIQLLDLPLDGNAVFAKVLTAAERRSLELRMQLEELDQRRTALLRQMDAER